MSEGNGEAAGLDLKYRPRAFEEVVGQAAAVKILQDKVNKRRVPQAVLFTGPSGTGKTTLARILATHVGCGGAATDLKEINSADFRGIDTVRELRRWLETKALSGKSKVVIVDECHKLTNDAQSALLKMVEEPPPRRYFFFATTDPHRVLETLRSRFSQVPLKGVDPKEIADRLFEVAAKEGKEVPDKIVSEIARAADGSVRNAVKTLEKVIDLNETEQLAAVRTDLKHTAIKVAQFLMFGYKEHRTQEAAWLKLAEILRSIEDEDPEGMRHLVLAYCTSVMRGKKERPDVKWAAAQRAYAVACCFEKNYFDTKKNGLVLSCFEALNSAK